MLDLEMASPWRTVLGLPSGAERSGHALPWVLELRVDTTAVLVTNHAPTGQAWRGPAFTAAEAGMLFAAAELERMGPAHLRALLGRLRGIDRPLSWKAIVEHPAFRDGAELVPAHAGTWSLSKVCARLAVEVVRIEVVEAEGARRAVA